jgi:Tol biopolymer transport system component
MAVVWPDAFVSDNSLTRAIAQIRKALDDDPKAPRYIETVPTIGYRFVADCREEPIAPEVAAVSGHASRKLVKPLLAAGVSLALAGAIGLWWMISSRAASIPYPLRVTRVSKLTSYPGDEREPAISPDGSYVAFSWSGVAGDNYDIYVVQTGDQQPLRLTRDPAPDSFPAWSPDGHQIAFIRRNGGEAAIMVVPPVGGPERILHHFARIGADLDFSQHPVLCWSPDGKSIIFSGQSAAGEKYRLLALSLETGAVQPLSSPDADLLGDSSPALSPDGRSLAFVRYLAPRNGQLLIQPLGPDLVPAGNLIGVKSSGWALRSPVWLDSKRLLFADPAGIFQWDPSKGSVTIYAADGNLGGLSLGHRRAGGAWQAVIAREKQDVDLWVTPLNEAGARSTGPPQILQRSTAWDSHPDFSPDGRHIAFVSSRSGTPEVWVSDADGANPRQLTHLGAHVLSYPKWSPDGTRIAFHARVPDIAEVYVVDIDQGVPRQITHANPGLALATWSNDGRSLYASTLVGGTALTYRLPAAGGPMERLWEGAWVRESGDGKYLLYWKSHTPGIFRRSLEGNLARNPEDLVVSDYWPNNQRGGYAPFANGIYYVSGDAQGRAGPFRYFDFAAHKSTDVAPAAPGLERGFTVSPDRRRMVFAASAEIGGDLLSLELR